MCGELLFRRCNRHSVRTARVHTPARAWMAWPKASKESGMSQPLTLLLARKASQSWTGPKLGDSPIHSPQLSATLPHRQVPCHGSEQRLRSRAEQSRARVTRQRCDAAVREKKWRSGREKRSGGGSADAEAKADSADASHSADLSASSDLSRFSARPRRSPRLRLKRRRSEAEAPEAPLPERLSFRPTSYAARLGERRCRP